MKPSHKLSIPGREIPLWFWGFGYFDLLWHTAGPGLIPLGVISAAGFLAALALSFFSNRSRWAGELSELLLEVREGLRASPLVTGAYIGCFALLFLSFAFGFFSAMRPPHLPQEYDAINYQMGIPRQLLVRHSLAGIDWATADLWPMALQWGMAPASSAFSTINKIPQFLFILGTAACLFRIPRQLDPGNRKLFRLIPLFAVMGTHGIMVQIGTGMMDLPLLYLLLLSLSNVLAQRWISAGVALAVFTASKTFNLFFAIPLVALGLGWAFLRAERAFSRPAVTRFTPAFLVLGALLLLRSSVLSFEATGTPLFPIASCKFAGGTLCEGPRAAAVAASAADLMLTRDRYGNGRGPRAFLLFLWRVAVPTQGVNNEFDYPLGLAWPLFVVLLVFAAFSGEWRNPILLAGLICWGLWWMNSHQSRWLYPTLAFGFLGTLEGQRRSRHILPLLCLLSSALSLVSQARSILPTAHSSSEEIQAREAAKVRWAREGVLESSDLLYVDRPALDHVSTRSVWVLK